MSIRKRDELRVWMLGAATTGLFWQSYPAVGQSADVIASNAKAVTTKAAPAQPGAEPRQLPVSVRPSRSNEIQLTSQTNGGKSEVQRQLEALYEQDGREMPETGNFNMQPVNPQATPAQAPAKPPVQQIAPQAAPAARPAFAPRAPQAAATPTQRRFQQGYQQQYQPRHQAAPYPNPNQVYSQQPRPEAVAPIEPARMPSAAPASRNPVVGFFRKLSGNSRPLPTQAPLPPDVLQTSPDTPMLTAVPNVPAAVSASGVRPMTQAPILQATPTQVPAGQLANRTNHPVQPGYQGVRPTAQPKLANATNTRATSTAGNVQTVSRTNSSATELTPEAMPLPPLSEQPMPMPIISIAPVTIASAAPAETSQPLALEPQVAASSANQVSTKENAEPAKVEVVTDFPNPFPDEPEAIADRKLPATATANAVAATSDKTETTNATVTSNRIAIPEKAIEVSQSAEPTEPNTTEALAEDGEEPQSINAPTGDEDPFAVDGKDFVEPVIKDGTDTNPNLGIPTLEAPPALVTPPADTAKRTTIPATIDELPSRETRAIAPPVKAGELEKNTESHLEKMNRIRERFGMKGLKGFCPVSLRDERELVDARLEYQFTYRKQKFHFSSAKAREKFEANPIRYAPAAYGADVVALTRDKDVVEGTLEFAAWYKGRLYLLGSQANYDAFLADPSQYATPDGIE